MKSPHSRKSNAKSERVSRQHPRTFGKISKFGRNGWVRRYYEGSVRVYEEDTYLTLVAIQRLAIERVESKKLPVIAMMNLSTAKGTWTISSLELEEGCLERRGLVSSFGSSFAILIDGIECLSVQINGKAVAKEGTRARAKGWNVH